MKKEYALRFACNALEKINKLYIALTVGRFPVENISVLWVICG